MKYFVRKFIASCLLLSTTTPLFAGPHECLPLSLVTATKFTRAIPSYRHLEDNDLWILTSEFDYKNNPWQIWFGLIIKNIKTPVEALEKGQAYFNNSVALVEPSIEVNTQDQFVCKYGLANNTYSVYALSPPLSDPR